MSATEEDADAGKFNMDAAVIRLTALAGNLRAARSVPDFDPADTFAAGTFRLCKIDDIPEPSDEWERADQALKRFADELAHIGGPDLRVQVFDATVERHGYRVASGVSASWDGCHGWWH